VEGGKEKDMRKTIQVLTLCSLLLAPCSSAQGQQPKKVPRIVFVGPGSAASASAVYYDSFRQGLRELGYIEGKTYSSKLDMQKESKISFLISLPSWLRATST
jgi:hypothetical protein